jgi:hypothetical protein
MESSRNREQKAEVCQTAVRPVQPSTLGPVGRIQIASLGSQDALAPSTVWKEDQVNPQESRGLTQEEFDEPVEISVDFLRLIERGIKRPHPRHWVKLAELVGVSSRKE